MVKSAAKTVDEYLAELPDDRRAILSKIRDLVRKNLPKGYRETLASGMIGWGVPLEDYPNTYNKQPLSYVALAAQKNYNALYLMSVYGDAPTEQFLADEFEKAGKKLDMGKSCLRFKTLDDLELKSVAKVIASTPPQKLIGKYEASRRK